MKAYLLLWMLVIINTVSGAFIQSDGGAGDKYGYFIAVDGFSMEEGTIPNYVYNNVTFSPNSCNVYLFNNTINNSVVEITYTKTTIYYDISQAIDSGKEGIERFTGWLPTLATLLMIIILLIALNEWFIK